MGKSAWENVEEKDNVKVVISSRNVMGCGIKALLNLIKIGSNWKAI
jgi:hypothetical protein